MEGKINAKISFTKMVKSIKNSKEFLTNPINTYFVEDIVFMHFKDSDTIHSKGFIFSSIFKDKVNNQSYLILTDDYFDMLPEPFQKVVIEHEIGHVINNEISNGIINIINIISRSLKPKGKTIENEFLADEYAVSKSSYSRVISCYKYMLDKFEIPKNTCIEFKERIKHLEDKRRKENEERRIKKLKK